MIPTEVGIRLSTPSCGYVDSTYGANSMVCKYWLLVSNLGRRPESLRDYIDANRNG